MDIMASITDTPPECGPTAMETHAVSTSNGEHPSSTAFTAADWHNTDISVLAPSLIPIGHIPRAWERRPVAFGARQSIRFSRARRQHGSTALSHSDRFKRPSAAPAAQSSSPQIAVKKLCLDSSFGIGPRVSRWEARGSPSRKIVTRSAHCSENDLLSLEEEDEISAVDSVDTPGYEEVEGTIVEVFDDQGNTINVEHDDAEEGAWEDEEMLQKDDHSLGDSLEVASHPAGAIAETPSTFKHSFSAIPEGFTSPIQSHRSFRPQPIRRTPHPKRKSLPAAFAPFQHKREAIIEVVSAESPSSNIDQGECSEAAWQDDEEILHEDVAEGVHSSLETVASDRISIPVPTIERPESPLRRSSWRSSRRQSASPMKQRTVPLWITAPHVLALSPIKQYRRVDEAVDMPTSDNNDNSRAESPSQAESTTQQKVSKPRLSDDTVLLQAFLNRAAESKSSRLGSSVINDEKSAMDDQPYCDVLTDRDPNTPSPKKSMETEEEHDDQEIVPRTRSGRARKRPESLITESHKDVPNKITIRNKSNTVDLKKTEAQEMALVTRNNTRKNKSHAVLPLFRLKQLATEASAECPSTAEPTLTRRSTRSVTWAAKLVAFSSEPRGSAGNAEAANDTASQADVVESNVSSESSTAAVKPIRTVNEPLDTVPQRKRRSRIATPAKGLGTTSLLPDDLILDAIAEVVKKPAPSKRPVSKLPAPANYSLGQGKENIIGASPVKRGARLNMETRRRIDPPPTKATPVSMARAAKKSSRGLFDAIQREELLPNEQTIPGLMSPAKRQTRRIALG